MRPRPEDPDGPVRAGFTATKKIGNAVQRNRAKRRLREAARLLLPLHGRVGSDYVFIARGATGTRAWSALLDDVETALISLARRADARTEPKDVKDPDFHG
jgi:ribonuclease P protein component